MSTSNNNGRALEACLVNTILQLNPKILALGATLDDQQRDIVHFNALPSVQQKLFHDFSNRYSLEVDAHKIITIERLKDTAAKNGDVTDIRIVYIDGQIRNISLKHNHDACKHQRPAALIKNQLGINNPVLDRQYRDELKQIENKFKSNVLPTDKNQNGEFLFNLVKSRDPSLISTLYSDIYNLVKKYLLSCTDSSAILHYFRFLVGNTNFEKVILEPYTRTIVIKDFSNIKDPTTIVDSFISPHTGYLTVRFDNNFTLNMRLHTASSRFNLTSSLSLKFDSTVDMTNAPVPQSIISF